VIEATNDRPVPRWVHVWAILTVIATTPLLALGGIVTTRGVGMSDPVWPTTPWYLFFTSWQEPRPGFLIEHTHRLAGWFLGVLVIVLAVALWKTARSSALRWLGVACLVGVGLQGLLGGLRVNLNALAGPELSAVHGCSAQIVFCILVSTAYLTRVRRPAAPLADDARARLNGTAQVLILLVFMQMVWGSIVRHNPTSLMQRLHLFTAFAVVAAAVWSTLTAQAIAVGAERMRLAHWYLGIFLVLQIVLGIEAWLGKFGSLVPYFVQVPTTEQVIVRTSHVLVGTGIFATSVVLWLQTRETMPEVEMARPREKEAAREAAELVSMTR
jgi:heme a synthase